ncbi:hypothetical protein B0H13DRAFT_1918109 [Mycena leptocephala]|nr:hypothetical protein B0H13DRAFT_1918109 [Mycena leptocephala]
MLHVRWCMDVDEPPTTIVAGLTLGVTVDLIFKVASKNQSDATVTFSTCKDILATSGQAEPLTKSSYPCCIAAWVTRHAANVQYCQYNCNKVCGSVTTDVERYAKVHDHARMKLGSTKVTEANWAFQAMNNRMQEMDEKPLDMSSEISATDHSTNWSHVTACPKNSSYAARGYKSDDIFLELQAKYIFFEDEKSLQEMWLVTLIGIIYSAVVNAAEISNMELAARSNKRALIRRRGESGGSNERAFLIAVVPSEEGEALKYLEKRDDVSARFFC